VRKLLAASNPYAEIAPLGLLEYLTELSELLLTPREPPSDVILTDIYLQAGNVSDRVNVTSLSISP
jgi:hypothetical protein